MNKEKEAFKTPKANVAKKGAKRKQKRRRCKWKVIVGEKHSKRERK